MSKLKAELREQVDKAEEAEEMCKNLKQELSERTKKEGELEGKSRKLELQSNYHR